MTNSGSQEEKVVQAIKDSGLPEIVDAIKEAAELMLLIAAFKIASEKIDSILLKGMAAFLTLMLLFQALRAVGVILRPVFPWLDSRPKALRMVIESAISLVLWGVFLKLAYLTQDALNALVS